MRTLAGGVFGWRVCLWILPGLKLFFGKEPPVKNCEKGTAGDISIKFLKSQQNLIEIQKYPPLAPIQTSGHPARTNSAVAARKPYRKTESP
jgi:hypothetical protein